MLDISSHDVVIVGGGGAGLRAAIAIAETDPLLSVAVVSKVYPMRSHTVAAEGGAAGVRLDDDSLDDHAYDTVSGGDWLCDQDAVEAFVKEAPLELMRLEHWGCPWSREPDGVHCGAAFRRHEEDPHVVCADETGFHLLHTLFQTSLKPRLSSRYDEYFVTTLLVDDAACRGGRDRTDRKGAGRHSEGRHLVYGRLRPDLPLHHQRGHQDRRWDGVGLSRRELR